MAELLIIVHPSSSYEEGDVLCAFNRRRIRSVHAQHLCHPRIAKRTRDGLLETGSLTQHWYEATHQYRFERVSPKALTRTDLWTGDVEVFSDIPNAKGEMIDVALFVERRKRQPHHRLFGVDGAEIWYGGSIKETHAELNKVWAKIENGSQHREINFTRWPLSDHEKRTFLGLGTEDFDEDQSTELVSSETNEDGSQAQKRIHQVNFRAVLAQNRIQDVIDRSKIVDVRDDVTHVLNAVVRRKPSKRR